MLAGPESLRSEADRLGVEFLPVEEPPAQEIAPESRAPRQPLRGQGDAIVIRDVFVGLRAATALPSVLAIVGRWQPDVIVHEGAEFAGPLAAHATGIPRARVEIGLSRSAELFLDLARNRCAKLPMHRDSMPRIFRPRRLSPSSRQAWRRENPPPSAILPGTAIRNGTWSEPRGTSGRSSMSRSAVSPAASCRWPTSSGRRRMPPRTLRARY